MNLNVPQPNSLGLKMLLNQFFNMSLYP